MWIPARDAAQESSTTQKLCHSERHYREEAAAGGAQKRATISPSALDFCKDADSSAHAEAEDRKLRKDPKLEVLALKVPFRNLQVVSESSPVGRDD
jgi:hypothetical protein